MKIEIRSKRYIRPHDSQITVSLRKWGCLQAADTEGMWRWQSALFRFLSRNALDAAVYFEIPIDQVIEVGIRLRV